MYYFYCPECKKGELQQERRIGLITCSNCRGGYGRPITHFYCPYCNFPGAGIMDITGLEMPDVEKYVEATIDLYKEDFK